MRTSTIILTTLFLLITGRPAFADVDPIVILNESFPSNTRTSQNPPDSAAWFTQTPGNVSVTAATRSMTLTAAANNSTNAVAYIPALRLPVGDKLALTCDITLPSGALGQTDDSLLVSLLNTTGSATNRTTADSAAARYNTSTGYTLSVNPSDPVMRAPGQTAPQPSLVLRKNAAGSSPVSQLSYSVADEQFSTTNPTAAPWRPISTDSLTWYTSGAFSAPNSGLSQNGTNIRFRAGGFIVTHFDRVSMDNPGDTFKVTFNANIVDNGDAGATTITSMLAGLFDSRSTASGPDTATPAQITNNTFTADGNLANKSSLGIIAGAINITQNAATVGVWLRDAANATLFTRNATSNFTSSMTQGIRGNFHRFEITCTRLADGKVDVTVIISQGIAATGPFTTKHTMHYDGLSGVYAFDTLAVDIGRAANFMDLADVTLELTRKPVALATTNTLTPSLTAAQTYQLKFEITRDTATQTSLAAQITGGDLTGPVALQSADSTLTAATVGDFINFDTLHLAIKNATGTGGFPTLGIAYITLTQMPLGTRPEITQQPASMIRTIDAPATFTIAAAGSGLTYQWHKDGLPIAGETGATFAIASVTTGDTGSYTCVVTNDSDATVTSEAALLRVISTAFPDPEPDGFASSATGGGTATAVTVSTAADFKTQVESASPSVIMLSGPIDLSALGGAVTVGSDKTIQGSDDTAAIVGTLNLPATTGNVILRGLTITNPAGAGIAITGAQNVFITHCTIYDCAQSLVSLTNSADNITISWNQFYYTNATGTRSVMKIGDPAVETTPINASIHHNWWSENCALNMPLVTYGRAHLYNNYFLAPGNEYGTIASDWSEILSENNIYQEMSSPLTKVQGDATLPAGLIRAIDNLYVQSAGGDTPDAGTDEIFTPEYSYILREDMAIATTVKTYAGNTAGAMSFTPVLTGRSASITGSAESVVDNGSFTLTAQATGFTPASYQWRLKNTDIADAANATYSVSGAKNRLHTGAYTVAIAQATGETIISSPFAVQVGLPPAPVITTQPAAQITTAGANATFNVVATGDAPLTYRWLRNGGVISGATAATLRLTEIPSAENGSTYQVIVSNEGGDTPSNTVPLTVVGEPDNPGGGGSRNPGGGGAPSLWFLGAMAILVTARRIFKRA